MLMHLVHQSVEIKIKVVYSRDDTPRLNNYKEVKGPKTSQQSEYFIEGSGQRAATKYQLQ